MGFYFVRLVVATRCCFGKMVRIRVMGIWVKSYVFMVIVL